MQVVYKLYKLYTACGTSANSESEVSIELFENDRMQRCTCSRGARKRQKLLSRRCGMQRVLIPTQTNIFTAKLIRVTRGSEKVDLVKVDLVKATAIKFESRRLSPHANYQSCPVECNVCLSQHKQISSQRSWFALLAARRK